MHKILIYLYIIHLLKSSTCFEHCSAHLQEVYVVPEAAYIYIYIYIYIQLRRRPPEDGQCNVRNMQRISINVLYINKQEFCASGWKLTKVKETLLFFKIK
jgi:hypothetical protein